MAGKVIATHNCAGRKNTQWFSSFQLFQTRLLARTELRKFKTRTNLYSHLDWQLFLHQFFASLSFLGSTQQDFPHSKKRERSVTNMQKTWHPHTCCPHSTIIKALPIHKRSKQCTVFLRRKQLRINWIQPSHYLFSQEAHAASASLFHSVAYEKMEACFIVRRKPWIGKSVHGLICLSIHTPSYGYRSD